MMRASRPSRSAGTRTSRGSAPSARTTFEWASKLPWRARIPTTIRNPDCVESAQRIPRSPAARGQQLFALELGGLEADHRLTEAGGRGGHASRIGEVRRGLDDRPRATLGILGLEDSRADEHAL